MSRSGVTQEALAAEIGVSQSTISRALAGHCTHSGPARRRVLTFIQIQPDPGPQGALDAVRDVWDGSRAHEEALAKLIRASEDLWPKLGEE